MLVAIGSVRGSPGASCLTAGLARHMSGEATVGAGRLGRRGTSSTRPRSSVLVVEADPAGGVFAGRAGLEPGRGVASLAAATRGRSLTVAAVAPHVQSSSGAGVLVGPLSGEQSMSALEVLAEELVSFSRSRPAGELVLADVGRIDAGSVAAPLVWAADGVLLVVWADREGLEQAAAWLAAARGLRGQVGVVLREPSVGEVEYSPREVSDGLGVSVLGRLPTTPGAGAAFGDVGVRGRGLRGGWWRGVGQIAEQVRQLAPITENRPATTASCATGDAVSGGSAGHVHERPGGGEQP